MKIFSTLTRFSDWGILVIRSGVGIVFIAHGMMKWNVWELQPSEQLSLTMLTILKFLSIAEPLGGIALIIGYMTPLASFCMALLMAAVIYMKIFVWKMSFISEQFTGWELDFTLLCSLVCILFIGPGRISIEKYLSKN